MTEKFDINKLYTATSREEVRDAYDVWAKDYDSQITDGGWDGHIKLIATLAPRLERDAPLLDAGAGSGLAGEVLAELGFTTIDALDPSEGMLAQAAAKGVYRRCISAFLGEPLEMADDSYAAVLATGVFTPGHAPPGSFDELIRITRPGGLIGFTLRHDVPPEGFHDAMKGHEAAGRWSLEKRTEPWQSLPRYEPEVHHEIWIWRVS